MDLHALKADLYNQSRAILDAVEADPDRRELTSAEIAELDRLDARYNEIETQAAVVDRVEARGEALRAGSGTGRRTLPDAMNGTMPGGGAAGGRRWGARGRANVSILGGLYDGAPHDMHGFKDGQDWFAAALGGRYDPRLMAAGTGSTTGVGESGGYMVPTPIAYDILQDAVIASQILPRVTSTPVTSKNSTHPRFAFEDGSTGLTGGFQGLWIGEAQDATLQQAKIEALNVTTNKLAVYTKASSELIADSPAFAQRLQPQMVKAMSYSLDRALVRGTGAGQPLGLLNSNSTITVTADGGQAADALVWKNVAKLFSAMYAAGTSRAVWLVHPTVVTQLLLLQNTVQNVAATENVGGTPAVTVSDAGTLRMLGREVIQSEHLPPLGDFGDVMFIYLSQYALFMRLEIYVETTNAVHWIADEFDFRAIMRVTGMPMWVSARKRPGDANPSKSWGVTLAAR